MLKKRKAFVKEEQLPKISIKKKNQGDKVFALAGNPNVGKSTVFNYLTGLKQHTGNWPGKTVTNAQGEFEHEGENFILVDIPGTYSLMAHSAEEEVARDFICFGNSDGIIIVCDATCLERNMNLVLQTMEITKNIIIVVNLMDEAIKKGINIDLIKLQQKLHVKVVATKANHGEGLNELKDAIKITSENVEIKSGDTVNVVYPDIIESAISIIEPIIKTTLPKDINSRWVSIKLLKLDPTFTKTLKDYTSFNIFSDINLVYAIDEARKLLEKNGIDETALNDIIVGTILDKAANICSDVVTYDNDDYNRKDRNIDKILTSKLTGIPVMILLLAFVFWLTIVGSNYPSAMLSKGLFWIENRLSDFVMYLKAPSWVNEIFILGVYRVVAWVVSVMLPPMAIFFPLFTILEDLGYLPRIAFNLDSQFKKCSACGKQALTMCMGFGCNAVGVVGCRIIDSPRERLIAILTNNFVPCNGRFPTIIAIITMFFVAGVFTPLRSFASAFFLTFVIVFGVFMTFVVSRFLSVTILKGVPSSFTLELPPYRKPQIGKIIVRSILDRTLFVLGRAVVVAIPAGFLIWFLANNYVNGVSILNHFSSFLDPFANLIGLDGVILMAFILGFPANEIVFPIIVMTYLSKGSLMEMSSLSDMRTLLVDNGWTVLTAFSTIMFSLMHWPCSTTCLTIKKETQSIKWTVVAFLLPTTIGIFICFVTTSVVKMLQLM